MKASLRSRSQGRTCGGRGRAAVQSRLAVHPGLPFAFSRLLPSFLATPSTRLWAGCRGAPPPGVSPPPPGRRSRGCDGIDPTVDLRRWGRREGRAAPLATCLGRPGPDADDRRVPRNHRRSGRRKRKPLRNRLVVRLRRTSGSQNAAGRDAAGPGIPVPLGPTVCNLSHFSRFVKGPDPRIRGRKWEGGTSAAGLS